MKFPPGFLFGAATAAHQVEGSNHNDWTEWEAARAEWLANRAKPSTNYGQGPTPVWAEIKAAAKDPENYRSGRAVEHYQRYRADLELAAGLGLTAYRFSVEWARIEPEPGHYDEAELAHYRDVAHTCRELGLEPMVTLWHFTLPVWAAAEGGFTSKRVIERFGEYAARVGQALGEDVRLWATLNEPEVYTAQSYLLGTWPPESRGWRKFEMVRRGMVRAHHTAYEALKAVSPAFEVGLCSSQTLFEAKHWWARPLAEFTAYVNNHYFPDRIHHQADWLGVQYYMRRVVDGRARLPRSDMGWKLYPQGHAQVLRRLTRYKLPLYITESGLADHRDRYRAKYIEDSLESIAAALKDGVDCRGYFHWSLLDNFEWHEGFWPRFGLVAVERPSMKRTVRPSAHTYAKLIAEAKAVHGEAQQRFSRKEL